MIQAVRVSLNFAVISQSDREGGKEGSGERFALNVNSVMNPVAFFANGDETGLSQSGEMSGNGGLGLIQCQMHVADADFTISLQQA